MAEWACIQWQTPLDSLKEMCEIKKRKRSYLKKRKKEKKELELIILK